jgi:hypothetical protein
MQFHGIQISEGSAVSNLTVASGTAFPITPNDAELFYRTDSDPRVTGLYLYISGTWDRVSSAGSITSPSGTTFPSLANTGDLFYKDSNDSLEGLYVNNGTSWVLVASATGGIVATGDVTGTLAAGASAPLTLAVIGDTGGGNFRKIAIDTKGRVTGTSAVAGSDITASLGYAPVNKAGDTITGDVVIANSVTHGVLRIRGAGEASVGIIGIQNSAAQRTLEMLYVGTGVGTTYGIPSGGSGVNSSSSLSLSTNDTNRLMIDTSGNVMIGRISSSGLGRLQVIDNIDLSSTGNADLNIRSAAVGGLASIELGGNTNSVGTLSFLLRQGASSEAQVWNRANAPILFGTNGVERVQITGTGLLLVGKSSASYSSQGAIIAADGTLSLSTAGVDASTMIGFYRNTSGTAVGSISTTSTATTYNTTSDARLKENIVDAPSAGELLDRVQVRSYDWTSKPSAHVQHGFIAQELVEVVPSAVKQGDKGDDVWTVWGVDYSKLVPLLVKEIQELRERVKALEQK